MNRKLYEAVPLKEWEKSEPDYKGYNVLLVDKLGGHLLYGKTGFQDLRHLVTHVLVAVEEVNKWISVTESLPEADGEYDVSFPEPTGKMAVIVMSFDFEDKQWYKDNPQPWQRPTHWRNRPSAPKQDKPQ